MYDVDAFDVFMMVLILLSVFALGLGVAANLKDSNFDNLNEALGEEMCHHQDMKFSRFEKTTNYQGDEYYAIVCKNPDKQIVNDYLRVE